MDVIIDGVRYVPAKTEVDVRSRVDVIIDDYRSRVDAAIEGVCSKHEWVDVLPPWYVDCVAARAYISAEEHPRQQMMNFWAGAQNRQNALLSEQHRQNTLLLDQYQHAYLPLTLGVM